MLMVQQLRGQLLLLNHHLREVILNVLTADLEILWLKTSEALKYLFTRTSITQPKVVYIPK